MIDLTIDEFRTKLRETLAARDSKHNRNPKHKATKTAQFEWLVGAYTALEIVGHDLAKPMGITVFLASVRGVEDALK